MKKLDDILGHYQSIVLVFKCLI